MLVAAEKPREASAPRGGGGDVSRGTGRGGLVLAAVDV